MSKPFHRSCTFRAGGIGNQQHTFRELRRCLQLTYRQGSISFLLHELIPNLEGIGGFAL